MALSGKYNRYTVFADWVACMALSIQNGCTLRLDELYREREETYINTMMKYEKDERRRFGEMLGILGLCFENEEMRDILGEIYMESGCGSKVTGQFFTPFHLSWLCAQLAAGEADEGKTIEFLEPSAGSGGMVIAAARMLKEKGIDYRRRMKVVAQDLDWLCVYMTYVQLSLYGINACVVQGDTLAEPFPKVKDYPRERVFITPQRAGMLL